MTKTKLKKLLSKAYKGQNTWFNNLKWEKFTISYHTYKKKYIVHTPWGLNKDFSNQKEVVDWFVGENLINQETKKTKMQIPSKYKQNPVTQKDFEQHNKKIVSLENKINKTEKKYKEIRQKLKDRGFNKIQINKMLSTNDDNPFRKLKSKSIDKVKKLKKQWAGFKTITDYLREFSEEHFANFLEKAQTQKNINTVAQMQAEDLELINKSFELYKEWTKLNQMKKKYKKLNYNKWKEKYYTRKKPIVYKKDNKGGLVKINVDMDRDSRTKKILLNVLTDKKLKIPAKFWGNIYTKLVENGWCENFKKQMAQKDNQIKQTIEQQAQQEGWDNDKMREIYRKRYDKTNKELGYELFKKMVEEVG